MIARSEQDLWSLVRRPGQIDAQELWEALLRASPDAADDYRTRLLMHESLEALASRWGREALLARLSAQPAGPMLKSLWEERFPEGGRLGFPSLRTHLVDATTPEQVLQMLRDLGSRLRQPARIVVGGSSALVLARLVVRQTEDVDVVDELPEGIRSQPALIDELAARHKLRLTHFASHYLPDGWEGRLSSLGSFGRLDVQVVEALDVLCGKLFSNRQKDFQDLQAAWTRLDVPALRSRVSKSTTRLRTDPALAAAAERNWYVLSGEDRLP